MKSEIDRVYLLATGALVLVVASLVFSVWLLVVNKLGPAQIAGVIAPVYVSAALYGAILLKMEQTESQGK